jgi:hypothetical protein
MRRGENERVVLGWGHLVLLYWYLLNLPSTHSGVLIPHPASQPPSPHGSRRLCSREWACVLRSILSPADLCAYCCMLGSHHKSYCSTTSNSKLAKQKATARGSRWITRRMAIRTLERHELMLYLVDL